MEGSCSGSWVAQHYPQTFTAPSTLSRCSSPQTFSPANKASLCSSLVSDRDRKQSRILPEWDYTHSYTNLAVSADPLLMLRLIRFFFLWSSPYLLLQFLLQPPAMTQACQLMAPAVVTAGSPGTMWCSSVIPATSCREPTGSPALRSMVASSGSQTLLRAQVLHKHHTQPPLLTPSLVIIQIILN